MKTIRRNPIYFSFLLFLFLICKDHLFYVSLFSVCFLWYVRMKDHSYLFVFLLCICTAIPFYQTGLPDMKEAKAVQVNGSYSILQRFQTRVIVYTDEPLLLDADYTLGSDFQEITSSDGFYKFNFCKWAHQQGVYYSVDSVSLKKENHTIRFQLQKMISHIDKEEERNILYRTLLNIRDSSVDDSDWIYENGFSFAGILAVIHGLLKYFLDDRKRNMVMFLITLLFACIFHFPLLLVENLLFRIFSFTRLSYKQKTGIVMSIVMLMYPSHITSASFLIPAIYRYAFLFEEHAEAASYYGVLLLQGILFQKVNPIQSIVYRYLQKIYGCIWILSLLRLFIPFLSISSLSHILTSVYLFLERFDLHGSIVGSGCVFYILFCFFKRKSRYFFCYAISVLLIFHIAGLFHPFCEISVINVGQGNAMLLKGPLNSSSVLIDTGKPSAWKSLETFLDAKGITQLDGLIITHSDDDHSGNKENVIEKYHPETIIEDHQDSYQLGIFHLYDINKIDNEDENQSSIVNVFQLNNMQVCSMADADETSEAKIIDEYGSLKCDVLMAGHHGSKTSSSDDFLDTVRPDIALISSGAYSLYHHPSPVTIQKFLKRHIPYFDTKTSGDITIICFPLINVLFTSAFEIGIL